MIKKPAKTEFSHGLPLEHAYLHVQLVLYDFGGEHV